MKIFPAINVNLRLTRSFHLKDIFKPFMSKLFTLCGLQQLETQSGRIVHSIVVMGQKSRSY